jgi:hypothetical protein
MKKIFKKFKKLEQQKMSKLRFRTVHFSSEDNGYPASELNVHSPTTKGWQSIRFCEYPQEIGKKSFWLFTI